MIHVEVDQLETWYHAARRLLAEGVAPARVAWRQSAAGPAYLGIPSAAERTSALQAELAEGPLLAGSARAWGRVPRSFFSLAEKVSCDLDPARWGQLYAVLWRIVNGERELLRDKTDPDVQSLMSMRRAVQTEARRMEASLQFHPCPYSDDEYQVAWYGSTHRVLKLVAPALMQRLPLSRWAVLTPEESMWWSGRVLQCGPGVGTLVRPSAAELCRLWQTICKHVPNPAALHFDTRMDAAGRWRASSVAAQPSAAPPVLWVEPRPRSGVSAKDFLPTRRTLSALRDAARRCEGCSLCERATQTVFGQGSPDAKAMLIGEQPGDEEDLAGKAFSGAAGRLLDEVFELVGIERRHVYLTNAVKHFKWIGAEGRRLPAKPGVRELAACRPWLEAEIAAIRPRMIVCLGATAARAIFGPDFRVTRQHGRVFPTRWAEWTMATYHPWALLRVPDETVRAQMREQFLYDLQRVAQQLAHELAPT